MIGIITAMKIESDMIRESMQDVREEKVFAFSFTRGTLCGKDVVVCVSGVGKVNSAACTQALIMTYSPTLIINVGVAGAACPELSVGDFVIGSSCFQFDVDTSPIGDPEFMISGINKIYIDAEKKTIGRAYECARLLFPKKRVLRGCIGSSDKFIGGKNAPLRDVASGAGAVCVDMESGSIAQTAFLNGVEFIAVRTLSDSADGDAPESFSDFCLQSAKDAEAWVCDFLK